MTKLKTIDFTQFSPHLYLAQTCLAQLLYFDSPSIISWGKFRSRNLWKIDASFPLAQYAAMNWISHYQCAGLRFDADEDSSINAMILELFLLQTTDGSHSLLNWVRIQNLINDQDRAKDTASDHPIGQSQILHCSLDSFQGPKTLPLDASILYYACFVGSFKVVQYLINHGADVNEVGDDASASPLFLACAKGWLKIARLLLQIRADVNEEGGWHGTALQAACTGGHIEIARCLLDSGADVNAEEGEYGTALQAASARGDLKTTQMLLEKGAEVDIKGGKYGTALQAACANGYL